jgi:hypothetical protein
VPVRRGAGAVAKVRERARSVYYADLTSHVFWAALGYFVYRGLDGALAVFILSYLYSLCLLLALIPFVGALIQYLVMDRLVGPWVFSLTGIGPSWLTALLLWVKLAEGAFLTFLTSAAALLALRS